MIRIIGIGSPFGDDRAGLEVARLLAESAPPNCEVIASDRPGVGLVDLMEGADAAILVDAVTSGAPAGTLHEIEFGDLSRHPMRFVSSHDMGIAAAIELARRLGRAPRKGGVLGVEIVPALARSACDLSDTAREAVERALARVRQWAGELDGHARKRLVLRGTVQGVGLRPYVWRLANSLGLAGFVRNISCGVEIEIEGPRERLAEFESRLTGEAPPAAAFESVESESAALRGDRDFRALPSQGGRAAAAIPPDLALCADCMREILDPAGRRYRYPFTNCTSCGPRFTVVEALPYDRATTTMRGFALCAECEREYEDPSDRRFRAEPIACPRCGPKAWAELRRPPPEITSSRAAADCIAETADFLRGGGVAAVQGIGGVHLACDAGNEDAVVRLRAIKRRRHKPLAVMVGSVESALRLAVISQDEAALLASPHAPIVLLPKRDDSGLAPSIAPGNDHVGIMVAYSPLHQLLMREAGRALVMTSANLPGEPLARTGDEARAVFGGEVDVMLLHDRPIHQRCDDSVWMVAARGAQPIRLSRGATPRALSVPVEAPVAILGAGGDTKNNFCLLSGGRALMSQYIGRMESVANQQHFLDSLEKWTALSGIRPSLAAHDLHPQTFARELLARLGMDTVAVQHHHAHVAACLAEHRHQGAAIGIAFDGTGYGPDGAVWGGEAMLADYCGFRRLAHLEYLPLAGGDSAIRRPARIAGAFLSGLFGEIADQRLRYVLGEEHARILARMVARNINTVATSSCGRVFDAVASLVGVRDDVTYEAQAAIELESLARSAPAGNRIYPFAIDGGVVRTGGIFAAILDDVRRGRSRAEIARAFHDTVAEIVLRMAREARADSGIEVVALSGGCFQNRLLLTGCVDRLEADGFSALVHRRVPANDGGLALGQAVVAAARRNAGRLGDPSCVLEFPAG